MYVSGHLYYLELTEKLPLHAYARTQLSNKLPDYNILDSLNFSHKRDEITVCKENALSDFPMIFTAIFLRGIKNIIVW